MVRRHTSCQQKAFEHSETYFLECDCPGKHLFSTRKKGAVFSLGRSGDRWPIGGPNPFSVCTPVCHLLISHCQQGTLLFLSQQLGENCTLGFIVAAQGYSLSGQRSGVWGASGSWAHTMYYLREQGYKWVQLLNPPSPLCNLLMIYLNFKKDLLIFNKCVCVWVYVHICVPTQ